MHYFEQSFSRPPHILIYNTGGTYGNLFDAVTTRSLRGHYAVTTVTTRSLRGHYGHYAVTTVTMVTTRSLRGHYGHYAITTRSLRSLRGHYAVTTVTTRSLRGHYGHHAVLKSYIVTHSRLRKRSTSLQNGLFDQDIVAVDLEGSDFINASNLIHYTANRFQI